MNESRQLIAIRQVVKTISRRPVLNISELVIYQDECVVIRGKNGSGKSTLLKILAGLVWPDRGQLSISEKQISWRKAYRDFRKNVVYLHQSPYLFDRSVEDNIAYGLKIRVRDRFEVRRQVAQALDWAGLSHLAKRNARDLSGGEKQRVALTRARILKPRLLLLDEPTAAMDRTSKDQTFSLIHDLASSGSAVYIATHEDADAYHPKRILELSDGQFVD